MSDIKEYFKQHKEEISNELKGFLTQKRNENSTIPFYADSIDKLIEFSNRGKMLRGSLVILSAGKSSDDVKKVAAAIELIHTALLIHDDIMDQDETRRGSKTIFAQYADEVKNRVDDSKFYGDGMAICCADIAFFLAFELLASTNIDPRIMTHVIKTVGSEIQIVGGAQMGDFHFGETAEEPTIDQILAIYKYKSARYTFSLPIRIGATIGGLSEENIKLLEEFGEKLGIVFQIKDDEIGLLGDEEEIGKPVGSDIRQNKKTLIRTLLYEKFEDNQKLNEIFGNEKISDQEIEFIKENVISLDIKKETDAMVEKMSDEANQILEKTEISSEFKEILNQLIEYNSNRSV